MDLAIEILMLFVPQFLLSLFSTLNFRDKSSLKILYRQPSLIILPTVTFFTFSRLNIGCCSDDSRVSFSKSFTYINITVTSVGYVCMVVWWSGEVGIDLDIKSGILQYTLPLFVMSILLTALFLHLDKLLCCSCDPREQLSVYDPDLDKRFVMLDGEVVEDPEDDLENAEDVEIGTKTCCGCFNCAIGEDTKPVLISFTIRNETITNTRHPPRPTVEDHNAATEDEDITGDLHFATAAGLLISEREEKSSDTEGDDIEGDTKPIGQSEKIASALMDDLISEITRM